MNEPPDSFYSNPRALLKAICESENYETAISFLYALILCFENGNERFATNSEHLISNEALDALILLALDSTLPQIKYEAENYLLERLRTGRDIRNNLLSAHKIAALYDFVESCDKSNGLSTSFISAATLLGSNFVTGNPSSAYPRTLVHSITDAFLSDATRSKHLSSLFTIFEEGHKESATLEQKASSTEALYALTSLAKLYNTDKLGDLTLLYLYDCANTGQNADGTPLPEEVLSSLITALDHIEAIQINNLGKFDMD